VRAKEAEEKETTRKNSFAREEGEKWTKDPNQRRTFFSNANPGEKS
jgi:hypothetical protein